MKENKPKIERLGLREKLGKLRQKQENSFTPIFFHRPAAILFLLPLVDIQWITPNRLTTVSILFRLVAAALLWPSEWGGVEGTPLALWSMAILWNVGGILDAADGTLARYRQTGSAFGRFYDKVSDRLLTLCFMMALSARTMLITGEIRYIFIAFVYVAMMSASSVAKWIETGIMADLGTGSAADPDEVEADVRTPLEWVKYWLWSLRTIFVVTEMDLPFWVSVAVLTTKETWLFSYLAVVTVPYALIAISVRGVRLYRLDVASLQSDADLDRSDLDRSPISSIKEVVETPSVRGK
ncbi:MAG: phosphatidylglycerophosphate synthase [Polyangiales bacterium]|jgi:phosphatidylglycerophosphate synthase